MKKLSIIILMLFFISSCQEDKHPLIENKVPDLKETIQICKSECGNNLKNYCTKQKTFLSNNNEITGTCRSFGKYNIGFPRCEGFCKQFGKNKTNCVNSDGSVNLKCN